jgi:transposase
MKKKKKKLKKKPLSREKMEMRRKSAVKYFLLEKKSTWIAEELDVSRVAVQQWKKRWREEGVLGLEKGLCGRSSKMTEYQQKTLIKDLSKGAKKFGFTSDRWTLKKITSHVKKKIGVKYSDRSLWHLLKRVKITPYENLSSKK